MSFPKNWFPYAALPPDKQASMLRDLGTESEAQRRKIDRFFDKHARPMIAAPELRSLIADKEVGCSNMLNVSQAIGSEAFQAGANLYAATLAVASVFDRIPCEPMVMDQIDALDPAPFTWTARRRLMREAGSFCGFAAYAWPALGLNSYQAQQVALAGAGLVHMVAVDSNQVIEAAILEDEKPIVDQMFFDMTRQWHNPEANG
jgi:hypothetical protein